MPGTEPTGKADRGTHQRRGAQGSRHAGHARPHGPSDALLLGYELRRNCGRPGRSPAVCRGRAPAGTARIAASVGREQRPRRGRNPMPEPDMNRDKDANETHVDEMTLLLYAERQLAREAAQGASLHTHTCTRCLTLLRALDRESRLLTRSMLEQDEALPARLAEFHERVKRNMPWIWGVVFGLAVLGVYALYTGYIQPWELQFDQAGFGSTNLLNLVVFQGAFWKGWQSMFSLFEVLAVVSMAGFGLFAFRRYLRRGSAIALLFTGFSVLMSVATPASPPEFRQGDAVNRKQGQGTN